MRNWSNMCWMFCDENDDALTKQLWSQPWRALWVSVRAGRLIHSCDYLWMPHNKTVCHPPSNQPTSLLQKEPPGKSNYNTEYLKQRNYTHPHMLNIASSALAYKITNLWAVWKSIGTESDGGKEHRVLSESKDYSFIWSKRLEFYLEQKTATQGGLHPYLKLGSAHTF